MGIYKQMHPSSASTAAKGGNRDDLGPDVMASDEPPPGFFTLLLPNIIIGFNMLEKKWGKIISSPNYQKLSTPSLTIHKSTSKSVA